MKTVTIALDAGVRADLNWKNARECALQHVEEGKNILWDLKLGLFDALPHPFSHQSQFLSLRLSLDHFRTNIWPDLQSSSVGVIVYEGSADYRHTFPWDEDQRHNLSEWLKMAFASTAELEEEISSVLDSFHTITPHLLERTAQGRRLLSLFCRDACVGYLDLLTAAIPDDIPLCVKLETSSIDSPALLAQLTSMEKYDRFRPLEPLYGISDANIAVCLPPSDLVKMQAVDKLDEAMGRLCNLEIPYKIIPETHLITEWDGLDVLVVCSKGLGPQGRRKLQGFCAAGGEIVLLGEPLGLPTETSFDIWANSLSGRGSKN